AVVAGHDRRLKLDSRRFPFGMRSIRIRDVPLGVAVDPRVETVPANRVDHGRRYVGRDRPFFDDGQVGLDDDPAVERRHRPVDLERVDQHAHAARRPSARDREERAALVRPLDRLDRARRQRLALRDERPVDVRKQRRDRGRHLAIRSTHGVRTLPGARSRYAASAGGGHRVCGWQAGSAKSDRMSEAVALQPSKVSARRLIAPLALAQFICSFAGSNLNVMINDISKDLDTTVKGVQTAITLFLLIMAILMIPCSKLTDRWGRKRCFTMGLTLYGIGALLSAAAPGLGVLILGNSVFEGVGTALLIPPVYILATLWFTDLTTRAWAFGVISGLGGIGAAAGPLIGGIITTGISWRAAFIFQTIIVALIVLLSRRLSDPLPADPSRPFDLIGAVLSGVG